MADAAKKFEVLLSFLPNFAGLDRFVTGFQARMDKVRAFNLRLAEGAQQTNQLIANAAAAISGAKIASFFAGGIKGGIDFNAQLEQARLGIAAVLKQFDDTGRFKSFDEALKESADAIELLKQKAVTSPASFSSLVQAFQGTVGPMTAAGIQLRDQVDLIVNMSQALAGLGIREEQILQETRALITGNINADAAAAKILGITAGDISSAKAKGQLYEFLTGKIAAFAEAGARGSETLSTLRSNLGDAFEQRTAASVDRLTTELKGLYTAATELVMSPFFTTAMTAASDKVATLVDWIAKLTGGLSDAGTASQVVVSVLSGLSPLVALFIALGAAGVVLRGSWSGLLTLATPLRQFFVFLTGTSLLDGIRDVRAFAKEWGTLTALNISTWGQRAAYAIGLVGGALAALAIGSAVIDGITNAQLARLEKEDQILARLHSQTIELRQQAAAIRDASSLQETRGKLDQAILELQYKIVDAEAKLDQQKALVNGRYAAAGGKAPEAALAADPGVAATTRLLETLQQQLAYDLKQRNDLNNPDLVRRREQQNQTGDRDSRNSALIQKLVDNLDQLRATAQALHLAALPAVDRLGALGASRDNLAARRAGIPSAPTGDTKKDAENEARRLDLEIRIAAIDDQIVDAQKEIADQAERTRKARDDRDLYALETQAMQAEAAGNTQLAQQIRNQIELKKAANDMEGVGADLVQRRLDAEKAVTAEQQRQAAYARALQDRIALLQQQLAGIQADRLRTDVDKQRATAENLQQQNDALQLEIARLRKQRETVAPGDQTAIDAQIAQHQQTIAANSATITQNQPLAAGDAGRAGMVDFLNSIGTFADNAAASVTDNLNTALGATSDLIYNLASGSMTFSQAWNTALLQVGQKFLRTATDMVAKMIWRATVERGLLAVTTALHIGSEAKKTAASTTGGATRLAVTLKEALASVYHMAVSAFEAMASIPYVGPILGAAAMAAALIAGMNLVKNIGHFATGGIVDGGRQIIEVNENGKEAVINAGGVARFGERFINGLNRGQLLLDTLSPGLVPSIARPYQPPAYAAAGYSAADAAAYGAGSGAAGSSGGAAGGGAGSPMIAAFGDDEVDRLVRRYPSARIVRIQNQQSYRHRR